MPILPILGIAGSILGVVGQIAGANAQADARNAQAAAEHARQKALAEEHERIVALNKEIADRNAQNYRALADWERYTGTRGAERLRTVAGRDATATLALALADAGLANEASAMRRTAAGFQLADAGLRLQESEFALSMAHSRGELLTANAARRAAEERHFSDITAARERREGRRQVSMLVHRGAGETGTLTGSGLLVATEQAFELEMDAIDIELRGEIAARTVEDSAANEARMLLAEAEFRADMGRSQYALAVGRHGLAMRQEDLAGEATRLDLLRTGIGTLSRLDEADWRAKIMLEDAEQRALTAEDHAEMELFLAENQPPTPVVSPQPRFDSLRTAGMIGAASDLFGAGAQIYSLGTDAGWW